MGSLRVCIASVCVCLAPCACVWCLVNVWCMCTLTASRVLPDWPDIAGSFDGLLNVPNVTLGTACDVVSLISQMYANCFRLYAKVRGGGGCLGIGGRDRGSDQMNQNCHRLYEGVGWGGGWQGGGVSPGRQRACCGVLGHAVVCLDD